MAQHVVELPSDLILAAENYPADHADTQTLVDSGMEAVENVKQVDGEMEIEELVAEEQYEIYFSTDTRTYFWDKDITNYRPTAWFPYTHIMKTWRDA